MPRPPRGASRGASRRKKSERWRRAAGGRRKRTLTWQRGRRSDPPLFLFLAAAEPVHDHGDRRRGQLGGLQVGEKAIRILGRQDAILREARNGRVRSEQIHRLPGVESRGRGDRGSKEVAVPCGEENLLAGRSPARKTASLQRDLP